MKGYGVVVAALFSCTSSRSCTTYSLQCTTKEFGVALEVIGIYRERNIFNYSHSIVCFIMSCLQQLDLMEAQHSPRISCMRILDCNVLCLSGSSGYLGVAILGEGSLGAIRTNVCAVKLQVHYYWLIV